MTFCDPLAHLDLGDPAPDSGPHPCAAATVNDGVTHLCTRPSHISIWPHIGVREDDDSGTVTAVWYTLPGDTDVHRERLATIYLPVDPEDPDTLPMMTTAGIAVTQIVDCDQGPPRMVIAIDTEDAHPLLQVGDQVRLEIAINGSNIVYRSPR